MDGIVRRCLSNKKITNDEYAKHCQLIQGELIVVVVVVVVLS